MENGKNDLVSGGMEVELKSEAHLPALLFLISFEKFSYPIEEYI